MLRGIFIAMLIALTNPLFGTSDLAMNDGLCIPEKVYLVSDKDYYIGGSQVFLSIFLTRDQKLMADECIQMVFVDLYDDSLHIQERIKIKTQGGRGETSLSLSPSMRGGRYLLKAYIPRYTHDRPISFSKGIFITSIGHYDIPTPEVGHDDDQSEGFTLDEIQSDIFIDAYTDRMDYDTNELVNLEIEIYDPEGEYIPSSMTVAVINHALNRKIRGNSNYPSYLQTKLNSDAKLSSNELPFDDTEKMSTLSLHGFVSKKGAMEKRVESHGIFTIFDEQFDILPFESDKDGNILIESIDVEGEVDIFFQAAKGTRSKKQDPSTVPKKVSSDLQFNLGDDVSDPVNTQDRKRIANMQFEELDFSDVYIERMTLDRLNDAYDPFAFQIDLEEVVVREDRISPVVEYYEEGMLYEKPGTRILTDDLPLLHQYTDVYQILKGRVPGMWLDGPEREGIKHSIILRGYNSNMTSLGITQSSARFMVNGSVVSTEFAESIPPHHIAFVDVLSSLTDLAPYGELGANGLVLIYLKPPHERREQKPKSSKLNHFIFKGYSAPNGPYVANHDLMTDSKNQHISTTSYWNPNLVTGDASVVVEIPSGSQLAIYDVIIEGITINGQAFRSNTTFTVGH